MALKDSHSRITGFRRGLCGEVTAFVKVSDFFNTLQFEISVDEETADKEQIRGSP